MWCEMLNFGLLSVEKHRKTNTIPINPEQFKSIVPLPLNVVCLHVMYVRDMTIFALGVHFPKRLLLKQYNLEYRPISFFLSQK